MQFQQNIRETAWSMQAKFREALCDNCEIHCEMIARSGWMLRPLLLGGTWRLTDEVSWRVWCLTGRTWPIKQ